MTTVSKRLFSLLSPRLALLLFGTLLAVGLLILRTYFTDNLRFYFLVWNLFLAWIPWWISAWLVKKERKAWVIWLSAAFWLLFFPNSPYILTDLFHLRPRNGVPQWFDLTLIISFAWTGLLLGLDSLRHMKEYWFDRLGQLWSTVITLGILLLTSYGIYLGRFLRWNSWDLFTRPGSLMADVVDPLVAPKENLGAT
ncbi:MAG: DUF1361 domain-containing protein, partial [Bacteroidota bacterium]